MHEWCRDWFNAGYYAISPERIPQGPEEGARKRRAADSGDTTSKSHVVRRVPASHRNSNTELVGTPGNPPCRSPGTRMAAWLIFKEASGLEAGGVLSVVIVFLRNAVIAKLQRLRFEPGTQGFAHFCLAFEREPVARRHTCHGKVLTRATHWIAETVVGNIA